MHRLFIILLTLISINLNGQIKVITYYTINQKICELNDAFYQKEKTFVNDSCTIVRLYRLNGGLVKLITYLDSSENIKHGTVAEYEIQYNLKAWDPKYQRISFLKNIGTYENNEKNGFWTTINQHFEKVKELLYYKGAIIKETKIESIKNKDTSIEDVTYLLKTASVNYTKKELMLLKTTLKNALNKYTKANCELTKIAKKSKNSIKIPDGYYPHIVTIKENGSVSFKAIGVSINSEIDKWFEQQINVLPSFDEKYVTNVSLVTHNQLMIFKVMYNKALNLIINCLYAFVVFQ